MLDARGNLLRIAKPVDLAFEVSALLSAADDGPGDRDPVAPVAAGFAYRGVGGGEPSPVDVAGKP